MSSLLNIPVILDIQPGEIPPTIHLKQGGSAVSLDLKVKRQEGATLTTTGTAVIQATPSFEVIQEITEVNTDFFVIHLSEFDVSNLTIKAGIFKGSVSLIDKEKVTEWSEEDYITTQPFVIAVQKAA